jgi:hypothetical protein
VSFFGDVFGGFKRAGEAIFDVGRDIGGQVFRQVPGVITDIIRSQAGGGPGPIIGINPNAPVPVFGGGFSGGGGQIAIGPGTGLGPLLPPPTQEESLAGCGLEGLVERGLEFGAGLLVERGLGLLEEKLVDLPGDMFDVPSFRELTGGGSMIPSVRGLATITPLQSGGGTRLPASVTFAVPTAAGGTRMVTYRNMGRPVLFSGDLAAVGRVQRVARRARRRVGGR